MEVFFEARIEFAGIMERYGKWVEVDAIPREGEEVCWGMPWTDTVTSVIHYLEENVVQVVKLWPKLTASEDWHRT